MAVDTKIPRITYPLSAEEVKEFQALRESLAKKADEYLSKKRVGMHRAYTQVMREVNTIVVRETNRMAREEEARHSKAQRQLKELQKASAAQGGATPNEGSTK